MLMSIPFNSRSVETERYLAKSRTGIRQNCHGLNEPIERFGIHTLVAMITRAAWSAGETALT
jgi:hypothetical protein